MVRTWTACGASLAEKVHDDESSALQIFLNEDLQPVAVNQAVRSFIASDQLPGWNQFVADSDVTRWERSIQTAAANRCSLADCFHFRRFDDAVCRFVLRAEPKFKSDGEYCGHLLSAMDVTDLLPGEQSSPSAEQTSRRSEAEKWHHELVSVSTVIKGCTDYLPTVVPEPASPDLAAIVVQLQTAGDFLRNTVCELSSLSRSADNF